jgi:tetratricopeptide (TPR) repeat protein
MDENLKSIKAEQEKQKGNEAFSAKSYEEAVIYYTRSLQYVENAASYNNRALVFLKLEKWDKAIDDCNSVFKLESDNVKALLRRSTAYFSKKLYQKAKEDIDKVLQIEPSNGKATELAEKINAALKTDEVEKKTVESKGGKRMVIEETDGESEAEEVPETKAVQEVGQAVKTINIKEVEYDSEDDDEEEKENVEPAVNLPSDQIKTTETEVKAEPEKIIPVKEEPREAAKYDVQLPKDVIKYKNDAAKLYQSGQYGDSIENYTKAVDLLKALRTDDYALQLAEFYENRASCKEKIGDFKEAIKDLNLSLSLNEMNMRALHMKAHLYELLEKYDESLTEYGRLMKLDASFKQAQTGYNRVKAMIQNDLNPRKKLSFDDYKSKGNEYVKLNDYQNALDLYTKCIDMDNMNSVGYLNRALCYLKLNKFKDALNDCNFVLHYDDSENIKALYRRALAFKGLGDIENALRDLSEILRIEPKNDIALRERQELRKISSEKKAKKAEPVKVESKTIEETVKDSDNPKAINKPIETPIEKQAKTPAPTVEPSRKTFHKVQLPAAITNSYEFLQAWNSINPNDIETYCELIEKIEPKKLPMYIGSKLDNEMFERLVKTFHRYLYDGDECDNNDYQIIYNRKMEKLSIFHYLSELRHTQRFDIIKLFLDNASKGMLNAVFGYFEGQQTQVSETDMKSLKKVYGF